MSRIGLIGMSAKPFHAGHYGLVKNAASENDEVLLFVSLADRKRPGEVPIRGEDMREIWTQHIEPALPANVNVQYVSSPVRSVYEALGEANEARDTSNVFSVYADPTDLAQNFPEKSLMKYADFLQESGLIRLVPTSRSSTVDVSGTQMRRWLASGNSRAFIKHLPPVIDGQAVWDILSAGLAESTKHVTSL